MKFRTPLSIAVLAILFCCKSAPENQSDADTLLVADDSIGFDAVQEDLPAPAIGYYWQEAYSEHSTFEPFDDVYQKARKVFRLRDSLYFAREGNYQPGDSLAFSQETEDAYTDLVKYTEQAKSSTLATARGKLPRRSSVLNEEDESFERLRESSSTTLDKLDFMFIGGAPFVTKEPDVFKDQQGNPETHYIVQIPENAEFFFNYVYSLQPSRMELTYGPPISSYEGPDVELHGIGSITHNIKDPMQVWLLTTDGAVTATILKVTMKLGAERGCISNNTAYTLACSKDLDPDAIFGVFTSADKISLGNSNSVIFGSYLWEIDLDGDGQAEFARIESTFSGASSDALKVAIWYMMVDGQWTPLDYGTEPDCT
jgi:hypothetical protein